jgi:hypothetical protein
MRVLWPVTQLQIYEDHTENTSSVLLSACVARCVETVAVRTTENTVPVLLAACVLRAFPSIASMSHSNFLSGYHAKFLYILIAFLVRVTCMNQVNLLNLTIW